MLSLESAPYSYFIPSPKGWPRQRGSSGSSAPRRKGPPNVVRDAGKILGARRDKNAGARMTKKAIVVEATRKCERALQTNKCKQKRAREKKYGALRNFLHVSSLED